MSDQTIKEIERLVKSGIPYEKAIELVKKQFIDDAKRKKLGGFLIEIEPNGIVEEYELTIIEYPVYLTRPKKRARRH